MPGATRIRAPRLASTVDATFEALQRADHEQPRAGRDHWRRDGPATEPIRTEGAPLGSEFT